MDKRTLVSGPHARGRSASLTALLHAAVLGAGLIGGLATVACGNEGDRGGSTTGSVATTATDAKSAGPAASAAAADSAAPAAGSASAVADASGAPSASAAPVASAAPGEDGEGGGGSAPGGKKYDCGEKGQKACPMQGWMKAVMGKAASGGDPEKLAAALTTVASKPVAGYGEWSSIAAAGAAKAKAGDIPGAKESCKKCHALYKKKYISTLRDQPW